LWKPLVLSLVALVLFALIAREVVDQNGGYFSNNEFDDWLVVVGIVGGACLLTGMVLVRRPVGRGILIGTVLAAVFVEAGFIAEVLVNSA
jgi:uncharacterized membrane protein HdeD (DUF308 family)